MLRRYILPVLAIIALLVPGVASAHQPFFNDQGSPTRAGAYLIRDPTVSKAIFGALRSPGRVDYYRLEVVGQFDLAVRLLVPENRACASFSPQIALIGSGIAAAGDPTGLDLGDNLQADVVATANWGAWSGHGLGPQREGAELRVMLESGIYYLAVLDRAGATGSYLLSIAGSEQFGGEPDAASRMRVWERCDTGVAMQATSAPVAPAAAPWVMRWLIWVARLAGLPPAIWVPRYP